MEPRSPSPCILLLFVLLFGKLSTTLKWLSIHNSVHTCDHYAFINKQVKFCKNNPTFMDSIRTAAGKSIQECQYQFRHNKWNCSIDLTPFTGTGNNNSKRNQRALIQQQQINIQNQSNQNQNHQQQSSHHHHHQAKRKAKFFPFVAPGTRESAFIHSLSSAGVAHQLTKSCSAGASPDCGCDKSLSDSRSNSFKWAGCSDNIDYGVSLSRAFVDALDHRMSRKNKTVSVALVNLHNNEAGRKIITRLMRMECKCHGVSGSCEIKTCWRVMPNLRQIGEFLRSKFEYAKMVEEKRIGSRRGLAPKVPGHIFQDIDLVYLKNSPDFCNSNLKRGSLGTKGRVCRQVRLNHKDDVSVPDSCNQLCCDRGHSTQQLHKAEMCNCKFQWCCAVTCSQCIKEVEISTCN